MLDRLPAEIDPFRLAESRRLLRGELALRDMSRLADVLVVAEGMAQVELEFGIDEVGVRFIRGVLGAQMHPLCQRCLEKMTLSVRVDVQFGLVEHDHQAERLPIQYEPLVVSEVPIHLVDIIEDELLLSLPQVPMHAETDCPARDGLKESDTDATQDMDTVANPFAILSSLRWKRD